MIHVVPARSPREERRYTGVRARERHHPYELPHHRRQQQYRRRSLVSPPFYRRYKAEKARQERNNPEGRQVYHPGPTPREKMNGKRVMVRKPNNSNPPNAIIAAMESSSNNSRSLVTEERDTLRREAALKRRRIIRRSSKDFMSSYDSAYLSSPKETAPIFQIVKKQEEGKSDKEEGELETDEEVEQPSIKFRMSKMTLPKILSPIADNDYDEFAPVAKDALKRRIVDARRTSEDSMSSYDSAYLPSPKETVPTFKIVKKQEEATSDKEEGELETDEEVENPSLESITGEMRLPKSLSPIADHDYGEFTPVAKKAKITSVVTVVDNKADKRERRRRSALGKLRRKRGFDEWNWQS